MHSILSTLNIHNNAANISLPIVVIKTGNSSEKQ